MRVGATWFLKHCFILLSLNFKKIFKKKKQKIEKKPGPTKSNCPPRDRAFLGYDKCICNFVLLHFSTFAANQTKKQNGQVIINQKKKDIWFIQAVVCLFVKAQTTQTKKNFNRGTSEKKQSLPKTSQQTNKQQSTNKHLIAL